MRNRRGPAAPAPIPGPLETTSVGLGAEAPAAESQVGGGTGTDDDEDYEPIDPHPDTPDDFDEDANLKRESEEAIPEDEADDDD